MRQRTARMIAATALFAGGCLTGATFGHLVLARPVPSFEIREGFTGLTNPLLECESSPLPEQTRASLKARLGRVTERIKLQGRASSISIYFRDLDQGVGFGLDSDRPYASASLFKVPLLIATLKHAEATPGFLESAVFYDARPADLPPSGVGWDLAAELRPGRSYTVDELLRSLASRSDNAAAHLLERTLPPALFSHVCTDLGILPDRLQGGRAGHFVTAHEFSQFFRVLYNATYLGREMSERALSYLLASEYRDGLLAGLPPRVSSAHKFGVYVNPAAGAADAQLHDCGIVYSAGPSYFLCVMTRGPRIEALPGVIAEVSRTVWEELETSGPVAFRIAGRPAP